MLKRPYAGVFFFPGDLGVEMVGPGLQFTRGGGRGKDGFYSPVKGRGAHQNQRNDQLRRAQSDVTPTQSTLVREKPAVLPDREPENRAGLEELPKPVAVPAFEPVVSPSLSNLQRFLESITPSVPAQYLSKVCSVLFVCFWTNHLEEINNILNFFFLQADDNAGMEDLRCGISAILHAW